MARKWLDDGMVCQISVNNPEAFNALSSEIIRELVSAFEDVIIISGLRVIIFRGEPAGKYKSPMAGADLSQLVRVNKGVFSAITSELACGHMEEGIKAIEKIQRLCRRSDVVTNSGDRAGRVFVLGVVDGPCLAGGVEFMFGLSDTVITTPRSFFGMREIGLGGIGGWRGPQTLREIFGYNPIWVKEMLLGMGDVNMDGDISAATALARGMVNRIVPEDQIEMVAVRMAQRVAGLDPLAVTYNLEAAEFPAGQDCTPAVTEWMLRLMMRPAWVEGAKGFLEGRKK